MFGNLALVKEPSSLVSTSPAVLPDKDQQEAPSEDPEEISKNVEALKNRLKASNGGKRGAGKNVGSPSGKSSGYALDVSFSTVSISYSSCHFIQRIHPSKTIGIDDDVESDAQVG